MQTDRYLATSAKLETDDIDWSVARAAGLAADEVFILTYFSDIESQTIVYLRDFLKTRAALEPDVMGFLTMWNYEEYFHGRALARLLKECGHPLDENRIQMVREGSRITEALEALAAMAVSRAFRDQFPALYMAWGASQELTTLRGYEQIMATTRNPVLRTLCERIAKQERRHFAWYFNSARERLGRSPAARWLTRTLMSATWSPVGAGVKSKAEVHRLTHLLFPGDRGWELASSIDGKISELPGLAGIRLMAPFVEKARKACGDPGARPSRQLFGSTASRALRPVPVGGHGPARHRDDRGLAGQ
jgi:rubrerythrin